MTRTHVRRRTEPTRNWIRFCAAAALVAVLAACMTVAGSSTPAQAAPPKVAKTWSTLMYRSLTATTTMAQLRKALGTQQATLHTRVVGMRVANAALAAAQAQVVASTTADGNARARYQAAVKSLADAKSALTVATKKRPRNNAAIARATKAVTAATATVTARRTQAGTAAGVLKEARTTARTATNALDQAIVAWRTVSAAIRTTERKISGVGTATAWAGQAAALSRDMVTQVRATFTVADTTVVYGVTVHRNVAYSFKRMLDAAKADKIILSGGGFRTKQRQIELRKINGCPDIWTAPASSCRVPTAIPGRSLHELGLAVDITSGGKTLTAKSPGFKWLAVHADEYGFVNLPSEAWHWSVTGG